MIVVLDTNVIMSALLSRGGPPAEIIRRWEVAELEVATSRQLLSELERVLDYSRAREHLSDPQYGAAAFVERLGRVATVVEPQFSLKVIEEDPADNRVLECAVAAGAAVIVTGDDHLLRMKHYGEIAILRPSEFLALLDWDRGGLVHEARRRYLTVGQSAARPIDQPSARTAMES